jgi:putative ferrous iron transport protein C
MILAQIRDYLTEHKRVTLNDLVIHFGIEAEALRGMLNKWISKGKLRRLPVDSGCGTSCCKCDPALTELYEWLG